MKEIPENITDHITLFVRGYGSQRNAAAALGVSGSFLNAVLKGKRKPGTTILKAMGLEERVVYVNAAGQSIPAAAIHKQRRSA